MISTTQSRVKEVGVKRVKICEAGVLRGIWESAISQNRAQRDDLTDAFIKGRMTGGVQHMAHFQQLCRLVWRVNTN